MDIWVASISSMLQWTYGCLCSFELVFWVSLDKFPEVGLLGQKPDPFLIFWGNSILLSTVAAPISTPSISEKVFPCLHILTSTCCLLIYWWQSFWLMWGDISLWFQFASLWWLLMWSIFSYICWPSVCPLWRSVYLGPFSIF